MQQPAEPEGGHDGDADPGPQCGDAVAMAAADQERHQDADDEGGLEAFS